MQYRYSLFIAALLATVFVCGGCKEGANQADGSGNQAGVVATPAAASSTAAAGDSLFTGFDGKTDFSTLLPGFRTYTIDDPSMAKIGAIQVTLSEATITQLIAEAKATNPALDETRFKAQFARQRTT